MIVGVILVLWGLAVVGRGLFGEHAGGAYGAGQTFAALFGVAMVFLGARAIVKAREARG